MVATNGYAVRVRRVAPDLTAADIAGGWMESRRYGLVFRLPGGVTIDLDTGRRSIDPDCSEPEPKETDR